MSAAPRRAPSAGAWPPPSARFVPDTLHFPAGAAPALWDVWPIAVADGLDEAARAYGLLLDRPRLAWNPPRWQLTETAQRGNLALWWRLATDQGTRARLVHARAALAQARQDQRWWTPDRCAALDARHRELAGTPPRALDERSLATLISALIAQYASTVRITARLFTAAAVAVGAYLRAGHTQARADTATLAAGLPPPALPLLPAHASELLTVRTGTVAGAQDLFAVRLSDGCDLGSPCFDELPALSIALARCCVDAAPAHAWRVRGRAVADAVAPRRYRAFVDGWELACALVGAHAQALTAGPATAGGLLRRALLAAGERLVLHGLTDAQAVFDVSPEAVVGALCGGPLPTALVPPGAARPPAGMHDPTGHAHLPRAAREVMADFRAGLVGWYGSARPTHGSDEAGGLGNRAGKARGLLHFAAGSAALWSLPPGGVVVVDALSPTVPLLPPGIAALVARSGGALCVAMRAGHAAGVPVVAGVGTALDTWPGGSVVELDSAAGTVHRADSG